MSLNRTLNRLFDEVRREAKRNPAFADRLDAVLRAHASTREVAEDVLVAAAAGDDDDRGQPEAAPAPDLNPVAHFTREGADSLRLALAALSDEALVRLMGEHNLDPAGVAASLAGHDLVEHIVLQAEKRVERDRKLFDY